MKILLVTPWDQEFGGVASVVGNLARYLRSRGHEVIFLYPGKAAFLRSKTTKWGFPGFELRMQLPFGTRHPLVSLAAFLFLFPITMYQLARLIKRQGVQIVNVHYPVDCFFYFALCRQIFPIALVSSVHGADIFSVGKPKEKYSRAMRFLLDSSDLIVMPSQRYRQEFSDIFPHLKEKATCIYNGINLAELNGHFGGESKNGQNQYVLCIAGHNERKGVDVLLRAFKQLQEIAPSLTLMLAGDGPLRGELENLAVSLGIRERTKFLGSQGRAQIAKLLHDCAIYVQPSRSESFGIAVVEALACQKPVVATKVGGIPEIIEDGKNGLLVEPDDPGALAEALRRVLKDRELQKAIAHNGYVTVQERFRSENTGAAYEGVFRDLLRRAGKKGGRLGEGFIMGRT
jgi:glycosyltransferase involved in cell wall biosynthesis